ncbi:MAG: hypothetical protein ACP6IS_01065 [Candidatus Asgardarchaeia archaeon]
MNRKILLLVGIVFIIILTSSMTVTPVISTTDNLFTTLDMKKSPRAPELISNTSSSIVLSTDFITIKISGSDNHVVPKILFWYTPDDNGSTIKFKVDYKFLIEFNDSNGDGVFQHNETIMGRTLALETANWAYEIIGPYNDSVKGTSIDVILYTTGWLSNSGEKDYNAPTNNSEKYANYTAPTWWENVTVKFVLHLFENTLNTTLYDNTSLVVLGGLAAKIDFEVSNWPFLSSNDSLAVAIFIEDEALEENEQNMTREEHQFRLEMENGTTYLNPDKVGNQTISGIEHPFRERTETAEQTIEFVNSENIIHGYFKWLDTALVCDPQNNTQIVDVNASYISDGEALRLFLSYPAFNGTLTHDPTIGVVETEEVPGNNPPSILSVQYPSSLSLGEQLVIKVSVSDDYGVDSVKITLKSPSNTIYSYIATYNADDGYYYLVLDTNDWQTGTWSFTVSVKDIYGAVTESQEYQFTVTSVAVTGEEGNTGVSMPSIELGTLYLIAGITIGALVVAIVVYFKKK